MIKRATSPARVKKTARSRRAGQTVRRNAARRASSKRHKHTHVVRKLATLNLQTEHVVAMLLVTNADEWVLASACSS
jgi:hypothetical protein